MLLQYYNDILQRIPYEEIQLHEKYLKNILNQIDPLLRSRLVAKKIDDQNYRFDIFSQYYRLYFL